MRHTAATHLLRRGVHPKVVQELLGHSTISLTLDTYSHVAPALHAEVAATCRRYSGDRPPGHLAFYDGRVDDERLTQLGNLLRRFANGGTRSTSFVKETEDYLLANFSDTNRFDDLKEPLAKYSPAGGSGLYGDSDLEKVFRTTLETISAICGDMGQAYLKLIDRYLAGEIAFADFPSTYWPMRRRFYDRGMWFEGKLGKEVDSFDTDVQGIGDTYLPISEDKFRQRSHVVAAQLRRVLS